MSAGLARDSTFGLGSLLQLDIELDWMMSVVLLVLRHSGVTFRAVNYRHPVLLARANGRLETIE